jgi:hypothetical protein
MLEMEGGDKGAVEGVDRSWACAIWPIKAVQRTSAQVLLTSITVPARPCAAFITAPQSSGAGAWLPARANRYVPIRYAELAECSRRRIHHRVGAKDEVFVRCIGRRQVAAHQRRTGAPMRTAPALRRIGKHMHVLQVQARGQRLQVLAEGVRVSVLAAAEQHHRPLVAAVRHGDEASPDRGLKRG